MKKVFNLSVILAVLMAAFSFTSCSDDDDDAAKIDIKVETTTTSAIVAITSEEDLTAVELWQNGSKSKNITVKDGSAKGKAGVNTYTITGLENGKKYTIKATSESGAAEKEFTVGSNDEEGDDDTEFTADEYTVKAGDVIEYEHGALFGEIEVVSASTEAIVVKVNGGSEQTLSDAGTSYLSIMGAAINKAGADASNEILVAKVNKKAILAGGASSELATNYTKNATKLNKK